MTDQTYTDAATAALAAGVAAMFNGLVDNGMTRDEALQVVIAWLTEMVARQP